MKLPHWLALSALLSTGYILWSLREIIIQIFAGIVIAMALCTLVNKLKTIIPVSRSIALLICLLGVIMIFGLLIIIVVPPFTEEFQQLIIQLPSAANTLSEIARDNLIKINDFIYGDTQTNVLGGQVFSNGFNPLPDGTTLANGVGDGIKKILGLAGNVGSGLLQILFILAVSLMVAIQPSSYREVIIILVPSFYRKRARSILHECGKALSNWMVGVLISSFCVAILAGIGLSI